MDSTETTKRRFEDVEERRREEKEKGEGEGGWRDALNPNHPKPSKVPIRT
jgi:hypothetical protein